MAAATSRPMARDQHGNDTPRGAPETRPRELTIGIAGAAGDGLDKTGDTLAQTAARLGLSVYAYNSYQSLIRGGHTWLRLRMGEQPVPSHGDHLHALIALNQDSVERHAREVESGGVILFNGDRLACGSNLTRADVRVLPIPFKSITQDLGKLLPVMQNTVALGALMHLSGLEFDRMAEVLADTFRHKGSEIIEQNVGVARAGYDYARSNWQPLEGRWTFSEHRLAFMNGNTALALGAVAGGCKFYAAYPMSPASHILHWLTAHSEKCGVVVKQAEDEIAVANMTIGAGHAGVRAMCATSGGGFALMTEAIGMAGMIETPAVFINVQRGGPSTGIPTKTEQGDLNQALGASQGDFPRVIVAPANVVDCYYAAAEAHNIAEQFQLPVILLSDLLLSEHTETVDPRDLNPELKIDRGALLRQAPLAGTNGGYKRYAITPSGVSPRILPGTEGGVYVSGTDEHDEEGWLISDEHTNASLRRVMHEKRMRKMEGVLAQLPPPELYGPADAEVTLIGWGSTWGAIRDAMVRLAEAGMSANHLHLRYLVPFHAREVTEILKRCRCTAVVESNFSGQFARHLRAETGIGPDHLVLRYDGEPFEPAQVAARVLRLIREPGAMREVTEDEAREIAYHYIRIHLADKARPIRFTAAPANGSGEPLWEIELAERQKGEPMGDLLIGRTSGATYEHRK